MNVRLQAILLRAGSLPDDRQDVLAGLVESFMAGEDGADPITPEELEELRRVGAGPDDLAHPEAVATLIASRSGAAVFTSEELAHPDRLAAEPFVEADPEEIAAFFGRRG